MKTQIPDTKVQVLEALLAFVSRYRPLDQCVVATLGGRGLEAELWLKAGIAGSNGFLIERGRNSSRALLRRNFPYRHTDRLGQFARKLRTLKGQRASLDLLHVDLCGTMEPKLDDVKSLIPLVARSRAQCLAVTVADMRRNLTLETPLPDVKLRAGRYLVPQTAAEGFFNELLLQQKELPTTIDLPAFFHSADPAKGAARELGVFASVMEALNPRPGRTMVVPDAIERYVFISRWSGRPFRMRSYFFHLKRTRNNLIQLLAAENVWRSSRLCFLKNGETTVIAAADRPRSTEVSNFAYMVTSYAAKSPQPDIQPAGEEPTMIEAETKYEHLRKLAEAAGGKALTDFKELAARNRGLEMAFSAVAQVMQGLTPDSGAPAGITPATGQKTPRPSAAAEVNDRMTAVRLAEALRLLPTKLKASVMLLTAAAEAGSTNVSKLDPGAVSAVYKLLGLGRKKSRHRTAGAMLARTQGRFAARFVHSIMQNLDFPSVYSVVLGDHLAALYSQLLGRTITYSDLIQRPELLHRKTAKPSTASKK